MNFNSHNKLYLLLCGSLHIGAFVPAPKVTFPKMEIDLALQQHLIPVSPGETRLRTETAGVVAAAILKSL